MEMSPGKILMGIGGSLIIVGAVWHFVGKVIPFGRLPGDISIEKPGFSFYFPIATSVLLSVVFSLIAWFVNYLQKK